VQKGEQTRASILAQAAAMASVHGLEGLSIGRLAGRAGLSKSGLFGHFGSKEALQRAVLEFVVEDFKLEVVAAALREATGEARLRRLFENWMAWTENDQRHGGCPLMVASIELDDQPGELRAYLVSQQESWFDCIRRMAQKAVAEGRFRDRLDTRQFAFEFHSIGLGFNFSRRLLDDPQALSRARNALDHLIEAAKR
jgi:AcrR family transcriptional regulator